MDSPLLGFGTVKISPGLCEFDRYFGSIVSKTTKIVLKNMFSHTWLRQV